MRVLLVNDWTETGGGVEGYVEHAAAGLRALGDEVQILAAAVGRAPEVADTVVRTSDRRTAKALLQLANPFAVHAARRLVKTFRPDAAMVSMFEMRLSPAVVAALHPVPVVVNVPYYKPICPTGLKLLPDGSVCAVPAGPICVRAGCIGPAHGARDVLRYALIRRVLERAARVVTCSEHMRRRLRAAGIDALARPWPTSAPPSGFTRSPTSDPYFLYAGRLSPEKGVLALLVAFEHIVDRVPRARLGIVGDGPLRGRLEEEIVARGLTRNVAVHGWVGQSGLSDHLAKAWSVVVPSRWEEPLGLIALEAVVHGVPVVASAAGGLVEVVDHGRTGLLVPRGSAGALRDALLGVATCAAFPEHRTDAERSRAMLARHDASAHWTWLRAVLGDVV